MAFTSGTLRNGFTFASTKTGQNIDTLSPIGDVSLTPSGDIPITQAAMITLTFIGTERLKQLDLTSLNATNGTIDFTGLVVRYLVFDIKPRNISNIIYARVSESYRSAPQYYGEHADDKYEMGDSFMSDAGDPVCIINNGEIVVASNAKMIEIWLYKSKSKKNATLTMVLFAGPAVA